MIRASGWCAVVLLVAGCQSGEVPVRGVRGAVAPVQPQAQARPSTQRRDVPRPEPEPEVPVFPREPDATPERDLDAELSAAVGVPIDCVRDFSAPRPTKIRVNVSATVRPTGMVIMPSAYASGISITARECIERRVGTVVLAALDEPVSQSVSTLIEIDYEPPVILEADPGVPEPHLKDVRASLPKYPTIPLDAKFIDGWPTSHWISGGWDGGVPIQKPTSRRVHGPKPRPIDGYEVLENAEVWTDQ